LTGHGQSEQTAELPNYQLVMDICSGYEGIDIMNKHSKYVMNWDSWSAAYDNCELSLCTLHFVSVYHCSFCLSYAGMPIISDWPKTLILEILEVQN
jgi:hypothetical protein